MERILDLDALRLTTRAIAAIAQLRGLYNLWLDDNQLQSLPDELFDLPLVQLGTSNNYLEMIPAAIGRLAATLRTLTFDDNPTLRGMLPSEMWTLTALTTLGLENTGLVELSPAIGSLRALRDLYVSQNDKLRTLPEELGDCSSLVVLHCKKCSLAALPMSIGKLSLQELSCTGNPFTKGEARTLAELRARWEREGQGRSIKRAHA